MSQNQQTVFLRSYLANAGPDSTTKLSAAINEDLDTLRAEGVKIVRFFVRHGMRVFVDNSSAMEAYLTAYIQRPKPKEESPSSHLDAVPDEAGEWEPAEAAGVLSV